MKQIWETKPQLPLHPVSVWTLTKTYKIEKSAGVYFRPCVSEQTDLSCSQMRGVAERPSVEAPPSAGAFPALVLPAGGPKVELSLTAWAQLGSPEQLPWLSPRACPALGTPPGIVILPYTPSIRSGPIITIHPPPAQPGKPFLNECDRTLCSALSKWNTLFSFLKGFVWSNAINKPITSKLIQIMFARNMFLWKGTISRNSKTVRLCWCVSFLYQILFPCSGALSHFYLSDFTSFFNQFA